MTNRKYIAHLDKDGRQQTIAEHLVTVGELASHFASFLGAEMFTLAKLTGLLHDIGKYGDLFLERLAGRIKKVDHSSAGAKIALERGNRLIASVIEAHHTGLKTISPINFPKIIAEAFSDTRKDISVSEASMDVLLERYTSDGLLLTDFPKFLKQKNEELKEMLAARMLLSCLVDADYHDTSAFFERRQISCDSFQERELTPEKITAAIACLQQRIASAKLEEMADSVRIVRQELLDDCNQKAAMPRGFFTLTAPTGSGKTISMMSFALEHAKKHKMRRIIVAVPFLSIIDQNAKDYETVFKVLGSDFVLQHHSLVMPRNGDANGASKCFVENWNAEVVVTTNVQLLESLFANMPTACRKLHRIAGSVIIFDEIQAIPANLVVPTLALLDILIRDYGCSIVFSSATQPPYGTLKEDLALLNLMNYQTTEIVKDPLQMAEAMKRVNFIYKKELVDWSDVALSLIDKHQVLCVVNLKRDVAKLYEILLNSGIAPENIFCLSASLCPSHRLAVIDIVQKRLKANEHCILISTQCIEAGVNVDFPCVWRVAGPLEAILQAAGRCNRHGLLESKGEVVIFRTKTYYCEKLYPSKMYYFATIYAMNLLEQGLDLSSPVTLKKYYELFYRRTGIAKSILPDFCNCVKNCDFWETRNLYRLIDEDHIRVLVPYNENEFQTLKQMVDINGISASWVRKSQHLLVNMRRPKAGSPEWASLQAISLKDGSDSDEYYVLMAKERYSQKHGLFLKKVY